MPISPTLEVSKMTYTLCGKCLHALSSHEPHNGKYYYCACCFQLCEIEEFAKRHKPSNIETIMRIGAMKQ